MVSSFGKKLMAIGAAVAAPLAAMGRSFASSGSRLFEMVRRSGMSAETLSELGYAAEQTETDLQTLEAGVRKMQRTIFAAANGSKSAAEAIAMLGLDLGKLAAMNPEQQFKAIAQALSQIADPTMRSALAMQVLGRNGTALLPMMQHGAAGLEEFQKRARALGLTVSGEEVASAKALADAFTDLTRVGKRTAAVLGSALADTLKTAAQWFTDLIVRINAFIRSHKHVVVAVFQAAAAIFAAGAALVAMGAIISGVGTGLALMAAAVAKVTAVLKVLGSAFLWLVSPIGLTIAAVAALGAYLIYVSGAGAAALAWLGERFAALKDEALAAWDGIADALAAGDIGLAAQILWLTLKLQWDKGIAALQGPWLAFKAWFLKIVYGAFHGALAAWEIVQHGLSVAWIETTAFLSRTWTNFTSFVQSAWEAVQNWLENRWHDLFALFDDTYDAQAAKDLAGRLSSRQQQDIEQRRQAELARIEQDRAGRRDLAGEQHKAALAQIGGDYEKAIADVSAANAAKIKAAQDAVDAARAEWQKAIDEARAQRQAKESEAGGPGRLAVPPVFNARFAGLTDVLAAAQKRTIGVAGTFNPLAATGLAGGGAADRIAKATEQTALNTRRLLEQISDMEGSVFD